MSGTGTLADPRQAPDRAWLTISERGSLAGIRFLFFLCMMAGRRAARAVLRLVVFYYVVTHSIARQASRRYLGLFFPKVRWRDVYRHFLRFAEVNLDRVFVLKGRASHFEAPPGSGHELLSRLVRERRGAILLGAHLGSLDAMRSLAGAADFPLYAVVHTGNGRRMAAFMEKLNPELAGRILEVTPGGIDALLRIKELIDGGNLVALLGDRVGFNEKNVTVEFFGRPARFPTGAYLLSAMCRCPVYLTFGLYTPPNRYAFFCEPFLEEGLALPRGDRERLLKVQAQRFAQRLEHYCRVSPLNWFNFYDFWASA
ncbi:MAG: LpxL/LpxP family acyltransferase [Myxococcales bacterium]